MILEQSSTCKFSPRCPRYNRSTQFTFSLDSCEAVSMTFGGNIVYWSALTQKYLLVLQFEIFNPFPSTVWVGNLIKTTLLLRVRYYSAVYRYFCLEWIYGTLQKSLFCEFFPLFLYHVKHSVPLFYTITTLHLENRKHSLNLSKDLWVCDIGNCEKKITVF